MTLVKLKVLTFFKYIGQFIIRFEEKLNYKIFYNEKDAQSKELQYVFINSVVIKQCLFTVRVIRVIRKINQQKAFQKE